MKRFCFSCGKETEDLIDGLCEDCYMKGSIAEFPKSLDVLVCPRCGKFKMGNKWVEAKLEDVVLKNSKWAVKLTKIKVEKGDDSIIVSYSGRLAGSEKEKTGKAEIKLSEKKTLCDTCVRKSGRYYEGVFQLRGKITQDVIGFVEYTIISAGGFFYTKQKKEGIDFYIGNKKLVERVAKSVRMKFGAEVKKSFKLAGKKLGKTLTRSIIMARVQ